MEDIQPLDWVRRSGGDATSATSVCAGSLVLAAAGLLTGYKAACYWAARHQLAWFRAEPAADSTVCDHNRVSGGGVTAGVDFVFALNAVVWGVDHANCVQPGIEYDPSPPFNRGLSEKADATTIASYRARVAKLTWDRQA